MPARDSKGRFIKGNGGGPGRPRKEIEQDYLEATINNVSVNDWKDVVGKALAQAKRGDTAARKWLSDYLLGLPTQKIEAKYKGRVLVWDLNQDKKQE